MPAMFKHGWFTLDIGSQVESKRGAVLGQSCKLLWVIVSFMSRVTKFLLEAAT